MVVVYCSDERFAEIFAVSVVSLFENNKDAGEITVYLIENGVSEESKAKFQQIAVAYDREIITLPMPDIEKMADVNVVIQKRWRVAACGRLFIASLLPESIDKVIYADCDTIFVDSIQDLWDVDISGYPVGMVDDTINASYREIMGLSREGAYFNSGILLIDLKAWRECDAENKFLRFIASQDGYILFADESVVNAVFDGKIFRLPLKYNVISMVFAFSHDEICRIKDMKQFYTEEEVEAARINPVVVHFTHNFYLQARPWIENSNHPFKQKYLGYKAMTPWKDAPLWKDNRSAINKAYSVFCHLVPKGIMIWMSKLIAVDLTPMMHKYKRYKHMKKTEKTIGGGGTTPN